MKWSAVGCIEFQLPNYPITNYQILGKSQDIESNNKNEILVIACITS